MPRLFTGLELPPETREALGRLKSPLPGAKWVERENLHITLRFAGDIDNVLAGEWTDALARVDAETVEVRICGLGVFGGHAPHTLFASVETTPGLEALARANERSARNAGLSPESHAFRPHVTLARFRHGDPGIIARFLGRHGGFRLEPFIADRFVLFSSRPNTGGGPYVVEAEFPLRWAASGYDWAGSRGPG